MRRCSYLLALCYVNAMVVLSGERGVVLDVPYVKQEKNGCGAAALAMIMEYWQKRPADPKAIHDVLYSPEARGTYASEMERHLRAQGFRTFAISGEWSDLKQHLEKGRPLIVALKPGPGDLH